MEKGKLIYKNYIKWEIDRKITIDIKAIINLKKI